MKLVINTCYGGFDLQNEALEELGYTYSGDPNLRGDLRLIRMVEEDPKRFRGPVTSLKVVNIPSDATDYEINDYDGVESVIYVLDGKIKYIS